MNPYIPTEMVTIYRLNNNKLGVVDNVTTNSSVNHRDYQAYEASVTSRLLSGGTLEAGVGCELALNVTAVTAGTKTNSAAATSDQGPSKPASASLTVERAA